MRLSEVAYPSHVAQYGLVLLRQLAIEKAPHGEEGIGVKVVCRHLAQPAVGGSDAAQQAAGADDRIEDDASGCIGGLQRRRM